MKCKHKGRCVCGKEEFYPFTPHTTEAEEYKQKGIVLLDKDPRETGDVLPYGVYRVRGESYTIYADEVWGDVRIEDLPEYMRT